MPDNSNELKRCTQIKTILVLCIVLYHSMIVYASKSWYIITPIVPSTFYKFLAVYLNSFHIYVFTFISGYIYGYIRNERNGYNNAKAFLLTKLKRLVIPYVFVIIVWAIPIRLMIFEDGKTDIIKNYLLGVDPGQLWFLLMLFWVFVIYNFIFGKIVKSHVVIATGGIVFLYCIGLIWDFTPDYFQLFKSLQFLLYFHMGYLWRSVIKDKIKSKIYQVPTIIIWLSTIIVFLLWQYVTSLEYDSMIIKLLGFGATTGLHMYCAFTFFIILQNITSLISMKKIYGTGLLNALSKYGMCIYLVHQQIIYVLLKFALNKLPATIMILSVFVITIGISLFISWILMRFRVTRFLIGEK